MNLDTIFIKINFSVPSKNSSTTVFMSFHEFSGKIPTDGKRKDEEFLKAFERVRLEER